MVEHPYAHDKHPATQAARHLNLTRETKDELLPVDSQQLCTQVDYSWFTLTKLLSNPTLSEKALVSGTAQLLPSFLVANNNDTEISASISLLVERDEYTCWSDNFSNQPQNPKTPKPQ